MVYIGFGLLAASLSFLFYRHGFPTWYRLLDLWKRINHSAKGSLKSGQASKDAKHVAEESDSIEIGDKTTISLVNRGIRDDITKAPFCLQAASISQEQKSKNGPPTPSFTFDDVGNTDGRQSSESVRISHNERSKLPTTQSRPPAPIQQNSPISMPPPPRPTELTSRNPPASSATLMPPPSRPSPKKPALRPLPKPSSSLQTPPPAASSLQTPPSRSLAPSTSSLPLSTSTLAPSKRSSRKVLLDPGHSPLDWAYLTRHPPTLTFLRGASVPLNLIRIPPSLLRYHNGHKGKDAWGVWQGKVYNLTPYIKFHPGGVDEIMKAAGREKEGERLFMEVHPWVSWESMLGECMVGILVGEDNAKTNGGDIIGALEEMD